MTKFKGLSKRIIALILAVILVAGILPISIFADNDPEPAESEQSGTENKGGTWGSTVRFEYKDGVFTVLFPANEISRIISTRKLTKKDLDNMIPRAIKDEYDKSGLVGMLLSDAMAEVVDLGELYAYFPEELFDHFFTDKVIDQLKIIFGIISEEAYIEYDADETGTIPYPDETFSEDLINHLHIQEIFINEIGAENLHKYINIDYITENLKDSLVDAVIANMDKEALAKMIEDAAINSTDFQNLMNAYPNLINDLMVVLMTKSGNNIASFIDLTGINIKEKVTELGFSEIISQLTVEQLKSILTFGLTGEEYETLMANIDIEKLLAAMEEDNVDFSALLNTAIFSDEAPGAAAEDLLSKIRESGSSTITNLLKLDNLTKDQFAGLPIASIFSALTDTEKTALFAGLDEEVLLGLLGELSDTDKAAIINETIDVDVLAGYLDDAFIDELYNDGILKKDCQWFDYVGAGTAYSEGKTPMELYAFSQLSDLEQIKTLVAFLAGQGTLATYIDFETAKADAALVAKLLPKIAGSVSINTILTYFSTSTLLDIVWADETRKSSLINAVLNHFDGISVSDLYKVIKSVGFDNIVDVKRAVKFLIDNYTMMQILDNYVIEEKLITAISGSLFAKDTQDTYKVISPEEFIALDIEYEHYLDIVALINLILSNNFTVGGETVDAKYVLDKFGIGIIKISEVAQYLFEKSGDDYVVISPRNLIDTLNYKTEFMTALIQLIIGQLEAGNLSAQTIIDAYADVLDKIVNINEVVRIVPNYIFKYMNDEDRVYFSDEDNVDRSTFIDVVVSFLIQFITGSDNIKINTVFSNNDNENFADVVLDDIFDGTETDKERFNKTVEFFDSFVLVGKTHWHTGEHKNDSKSTPILTDEEISLYEGYHKAYVSLVNAYKALLDCMPDLSVLTDIPEDGIIGSINVHFDYRQWMDAYYFDGDNPDDPDYEPTYKRDVEAWEAAKKEIDFGVRIGLFEEDPTATYGPNNKTAIEYIEDFVERRIEEQDKIYDEYKELAEEFGVTGIKEKHDIYEIIITDEEERLIDINLAFVKKYTNIIAKALRSNKIDDSVKKEFIEAINGTIGEFTHYLRFDLTVEKILEIIDGINNSTLDSAGDYIDKNEDRIDSIRERILEFLEGLDPATQGKKFVEHFYKFNGWFAADGKRIFGTDKLIETAGGKNVIIDRFLEVLNEGDEVLIDVDFDIIFENLYQIKFNDKNGTLYTMYLPGGTELSVVTKLFDNLSDGCKWYVKDEATGKYTEVKKMPTEDTVVYKAYTVSFYSVSGELVDTRDFIHGTDKIMGYPPAVPFEAGTHSGVWADYVLGDTNIDVYPTYESNIYDVVWVIDKDNDISTNGSVLYGEIPVFPYGEPEKESDAEHSYVFDHWENANGLTPDQLQVSDFPTGEQTEPFVYYAIYNSSINYYTVTWKNGSETIYEETLAYGDIPSYDSVTYGTPEKEADAQYTYTFEGVWKDENGDELTAQTMVTGDVTYKADYSTTTNKYTVTWNDCDGNLIYNEEIEYGETPVYDEATYGTPEKPATAQYTYTFSGWNPSISKVKGDVTYTAQFDNPTINKYTVTWVDGNGDTIYEDEIEYGETPVYNEADYGTPEKTATAQYSYEFSTWSPAIDTVTADVTYTAQFTSSVNQYTVTWKNGSDVIYTETLGYGATPTYDVDTYGTPEQAATAQYTYTFDGWEPTIDTVTGDVTYTAKFTSNVQKYTITWKDGNGSTLKTEELEYGATPAYTGATPTKTSTVDTVYTFNNTWSPEIEEVTADATYTAQFDEATRKYTITWKNGNTTIYTEQVEYGATPVYDETTHGTPEKTADAQYTYTFNTWSPAIAAVTADATYTATYTSTVNKYTITWVDGNGDTIYTEDLEYSETPVYDEATYGTPEKASTAQYSYTFNGWDPAILPVTGDATYTAKFIEITNKYTITWKNGEYVIYSEEVEYGETPVFNMEYYGTPIKPQLTQNIVFVFIGWDPQIATVTADATYTAQFEEKSVTYKVTWKNGDAVIDEKEYAPSQTPVYDQATYGTPTRQEDDQYKYTFTGWNPIVESNGDITYYAQFSTEAKKYTVTWNNYDNTKIYEETLEYGKIPTYNEITYGIPSKDSDPHYIYYFLGWTPNISEVTGNVTYTAKFAAFPIKYNVTWRNWDDTVLYVASVEYGEIPVYDPTVGELGEPKKPGDDDYEQYEFIGWAPEIVEVSKDAAYTAQFKGQVKVTWMNENDEIYSEYVTVGETPVYDDETYDTPEKASTAQYTYTFNGWSPAITAVTAPVTYTAQFDSSVNEYTIIWMNGNDEIYRESLAYGETPVYNEATYGVPGKTATAQYTYTFNGWDKTIATVTGNATYNATYTSTVNKYTITWVDGNGDPIYEDEIEYGDTPVYDKDTYGDPEKMATAQYSYTFTDWDPAIATVTADATYTAQFDSSVNEYTITWVDGNGDTIYTEDLEYGATPVYNKTTYGTPTKNADNQYSYQFDSWDNEIVSVTGDATYTAQFKRFVTITWKNYDGTTLKTDTVEVGTMPQYQGEKPVKHKDAQYDYTFTDCWDPEISLADANKTYTAQFGEPLVVRKYTITWKNGSNKIYSEQLEYGATPVYDTETYGTPTKDADDQYTYTFNGWNKTIATVTADATYTAQYTSNNIPYTITWKDETGNTIYSESLNYGNKPQYDAATYGELTKNSNDPENYIYELVWSPAITEVTGNAVYQATFVAKYKIIWMNGNDPIYSEFVAAGATPVYDEATYGTPAQQETQQFIYSFSGWNPTIVPVTGSATYAAQFNGTPKYTITWKNGNNDIYSEQVVQGATPVYNEATYGTPGKAADAQYTYTFSGWDPQIATVTADATYTAQFDSTVNQYTIIWMNGNDEIYRESLAYGATPVYDDTTYGTPEKTGNAQYTYTFSGWKDASENDLTPDTTVIGDATYTAQFDSDVKQYTIIWMNGNDEIYRESLEYGATPVYDTETYGTPTKTATAQYTYTFNGWNPQIATVTGDATYKAQFNSTYTGGGSGGGGGGIVPPTPSTGFTITWRNYDNKILEIDTNVKLGTTPTYNGETPTKPEDDNFTYTFKGWDPAVVAVSGNATYVATFTETAKEVEKVFIAIFVVDGEEITVEYKEGENPLDKAPAIPAKTGHTGRWERKTDEEREIYVIAYTPETYEVVFVAEDRTKTRVSYPYGATKIDEPAVPEKFGYDGKWEAYQLNGKPSVEVKLVYTAKTFRVEFVFDDKTEIVEYTFGAESITEPEVPQKAFFSAAWETYELNKAETVQTEAVYTLNLWWLIILLSVIVAAEIVLIVYKKKKDNGSDGKTKLGGAMILGGSIVRIIPSFGVIACIILGVAVIALGVFCIIVFAKKKAKNEETENKDTKENSK